MLARTEAFRSTTPSAAVAPSIVTSSASVHVTITSNTKSFTIASNSNRKLVVGFGSAATGLTISNVKWGGSGGVALTQTVHLLFGGLHVYWFELVNPASGTQDIFWNNAAADDHVAFALDIKDAEQVTTVVGDTNTSSGSSSTSNSLTRTSAVNSLLLNLWIGANNTAVPTESGDGAQLINMDVTGECRACASSHTATTATSVSMGWTYTSQTFVHGLIMLRPV